MKQIFAILVAFAALSLLPACSVTVKSTEASSESFENTTEASGELTSSTSPKSEEKTKAEKVSKFIKSNFVRLRMEMAAGGGEHLESLAMLLDIDDAKKSQFFEQTQQQFKQLFVAQDTTPEQLTANLKLMLAKNTL